MTNKQTPAQQGWKEIKDEYSQSGLFDLAPDFKNELDRDVEAMIAKAKEEAFQSGLDAGHRLNVERTRELLLPLTGQKKALKLLKPNND